MLFRCDCGEKYQIFGYTCYKFECHICGKVWDIVKGAVKDITPRKTMLLPDKCCKDCKHGINYYGSYYGGCTNCAITRKNHCYYDVCSKWTPKEAE